VYLWRGDKWAVRRRVANNTYSHRYVQKIWDTSGYFWQTTWLKLYDLFEGREWSLFLFGEFLRLTTLCCARNHPCSASEMEHGCAILNPPLPALKSTRSLHGSYS